MLKGMRITNNLLIVSRRFTQEAATKTTPL